MTIVLIDDDKVLMGDEAVDVLSDSETQEDLKDIGIITNEFTAGMRITSIAKLHRKIYSYYHCSATK